MKIPGYTFLLLLCVLIVGAVQGIRKNGAQAINEDQASTTTAAKPDLSSFSSLNFREAARNLLMVGNARMDGMAASRGSSTIDSSSLSGYFQAFGGNDDNGDDGDGNRNSGPGSGPSESPGSSPSYYYSKKGKGKSGKGKSGKGKSGKGKNSYPLPAPRPAPRPGPSPGPSPGNRPTRNPTATAAPNAMMTMPPAVGTGNCGCDPTPLAVQFVMLRANNTVTIAPGVDLATVGSTFVYLDELFDFNVTVIPGNFVSGYCHRLLPLVLVTGGSGVAGQGYCHFTFTITDGTNSVTFNAAGEVFDVAGGILTITGGTGALQGVYGQAEIVPFFENNGADFFLEPTLYTVSATLLVPAS